MTNRERFAWSAVAWGVAIAMTSCGAGGTGEPGGGDDAGVGVDAESNGTDAVPHVTCTAEKLGGEVREQKKLKNLSSECVDYTVTETIRLADKATLTVEPGVTVAFDQGAGIRVGPGTALNAVGTKSKPIVFTGTEAKPGHWRGIVYDGSNRHYNRLDRVVVEYGGGGAADEAAAANLMLASPQSRVTVVEATLRHSAGYGLGVAPRTSLPEFAKNTMTDNAKGPIRIDANAVHYLDAASTYGAEKDPVRVATGNLVHVEHGVEYAWPATGAGYRIEGPVQVSGHLTLKPGATLAFEKKGAMLIKSGGSLTAVGRAEAPITFTGTRQEKGHWQGLLFSRSDSRDNELRHAVLEYGGASEPIVPGVEKGGNIVVSASAGSTDCRVRIADSEVRGSGNYGILLQNDGGVVESCKGVEFAGNALGPTNAECPTN